MVIPPGPTFPGVSGPLLAPMDPFCVAPRNLAFPRPQRASLGPIPVRIRGYPQLGSPYRLAKFMSWHPRETASDRLRKRAIRAEGRAPRGSLRRRTCLLWGGP